jgi:SH3-like domain-containing protein
VGTGFAASLLAALRPGPLHIGLFMRLDALRFVPVLVLALLPEAVAAAETPSGLPLPRFVTTRSSPINVRVGPGTRYDVSWVYKVAGTPVEIIQEFEIWRKIRDVDGSEGWVQQSMLSGSRAGYVVPEANVERVALRLATSDEAGVAAWVGPGFPVKIQSCEAGWCAVQAVDHPNGHPTATYSGYLPEGDLWGVYRGESFD